MAIDPPYRLDPFQNIVNVKWLAKLKRPFIYYFLFTQTVGGYHAFPSYNYAGRITGTYTGPFKEVLSNYYDPRYDPPEPEPSDGPPPPDATGSFTERTYSAVTFLDGPADWIDAAGNWWQNTSVYWDYRSPGDVTIFYAAYGYEYPDYIQFIGIPSDWQNALPDGYSDPVPNGSGATDYPFL